MAVPARIPALVLCLAMCGYAFTGSHHRAAFKTAASFRTPTCDRACRHAARGVEAQRTCRRRARPPSTCRRKASTSSAGRVRLSAVEGEDDEGDDTAGVYVATEVSGTAA